jgi:hypothetical protein
MTFDLLIDLLCNKNLFIEVPEELTKNLVENLLF